MAVISQDRQYFEVTWTVTSIDILLGLIGGFVSLIWSLLGYFLGGYENFRFQQELISEVYSTTDNQRMKRDREPDNYDDARKDLTHSLESKALYDYFYLDYLAASLMKCFCCCFSKRKCYRKRIKKLQRHEFAQEQLTAETDFFTFLKLLRLTDFMSRLMLKEYQRSLIPYFKRYQLTTIEGDSEKKVFDTAQKLGSIIDGADEERQALKIAELNLQETVRELTFNDNAADLAIMYEVTGFQADHDFDGDFWANYESY